MSKDKDASDSSFILHPSSFGAQRLAFLQDCKENPDDDTPRLVFADWLEERDDPRGSLIRVQCQKERTSPLDVRRNELQAQEHDLIAAHGPDWLASLGDLPGNLSFHRGLLRLTISQDEALQQLTHWGGRPDELVWLEEIRSSLSALPRLLAGPRSVVAACTSLDLSASYPTHYPAPPDPVTASARGLPFNRGEWRICQDLRHLRRLSLSGQTLEGNSITALARSSLDSLKDLQLAYAQCGEDALAALVQADWLPRLTSLNLGHNRIGDEGLRRLLPTLPGSSLRRLVLSYATLGEKSLDRLAGTGILSRLTWLDLAGNNLRGAGFRALGQLREPGRLVWLNLSSNGLEDDDVVALASSPLLAHVQTLDLSINRIGRRGAEALAASPYLGRLTFLDLSYNQLASTPLSLWLATPGLSGLRILHLGNNRIDDAALEGLSRLPLRAPLRTLILRRNVVSDQGLTQLLESPLVEHLSMLDLGSNQLRLRGARMLAQTTFGRLRILLLDNNEVGDTGALALAGSRPIQQLTQLNARGNRILGAGLEALQRRFGARIDV